jgi:hypothetical protein
MKAEYPDTLYVVEEHCYPIYDIKHLVGKHTLESAVPDNNVENEVAIYQLVRVEKYKKITTRTSIVEKV